MGKAKAAKRIAGLVSRPALGPVVPAYYRLPVKLAGGIIIKINSEGERKMRKGNYRIGALWVFCLAGFGLISRLVANHGIDGFDRAVAGGVQSFSDDRLVG